MEGGAGDGMEVVGVVRAGSKMGEKDLPDEEDEVMLIRRGV